MIKTVKVKNGIGIIALEGNLNVGVKDKFQEELHQKLPSETKKIVFDLSSLDFIDSACLGSLVGLIRELRAKGGDIYLADCQDEVRSIFQLTRLDKIFTITDTVDQAVSAFI